MQITMSAEPMISWCHGRWSVAVVSILILMSFEVSMILGTGVNGSTPLWSGKCGDSLNCGCTSLSGPDRCDELEQVWMLELEVDPSSEPFTKFIAVGPDGMVLASWKTMLGSFNVEKKIALWELRMEEGDIITSPTVFPLPREAHPEIVPFCFGTSEGNLFGYSYQSDKRPELDWATSFPNGVRYLQSDNSGRRLYVGTVADSKGSGHFYIVDTATGGIMWSSEENLIANPAVTSLGDVVVTATLSGVVASYISTTTDGQLIVTTMWNQEGVLSSASPAIAVEEDVVFIVRVDGRLSCLDLDTGDILWEFSTNMYPLFSPSISFANNDSLVVVGPHAVIGISSNGLIEWNHTFSYDTRLAGPATCDAGGYIWVGVSGSLSVYVFDAEGNLHTTSQEVYCSKCTVDPHVASSIVLASSRRVAYLLQTNALTLTTLDMECLDFSLEFIKKATVLGAVGFAAITVCIVMVLLRFKKVKRTTTISQPDDDDGATQSLVRPASIYGSY